MPEVTAALVKELREKTGAGMMDCKRALGDSNGDIEAAVDWLRKKGLSAAAKKAGRVAAEGLIGVATRDTAGALVEVNSETDFVARNEAFQSFVRTVTELAVKGDGELETLVKTPYPETGRNVEEELTHLIATIGENLVLRRSARLAVGQGGVFSYMHNALGPGLGKIGVIVALESAASHSALADLGRQLAMHVAAASPLYLDIASVPPAALERERGVLREQARTTANRATSSSGWSRAGCASSTKSSCCSSRSLLSIRKPASRKWSRMRPKRRALRSPSLASPALRWVRASSAAAPISRQRSLRPPRSPTER